MVVFGIGLSGFFVYLLNADKASMKALSEYKDKANIEHQLTQKEITKLDKQVHKELVEIRLTTQLTAHTVDSMAKTLEEIERKLDNNNALVSAPLDTSSILIYPEDEYYE